MSESNHQGAEQAVLPLSQEYQVFSTSIASSEMNVLHKLKWQMHGSACRCKYRVQYVMFLYDTGCLCVFSLVHVGGISDHKTTLKEIHQQIKPLG